MFSIIRDYDIAAKRRVYRREGLANGVSACGSDRNQFVKKQSERGQKVRVRLLPHVASQIGNSPISRQFG
jgi:hypothetical protein